MPESKPVEPPPESAEAPQPSTSREDEFRPITPQEIVGSACAILLLAAFFAPWVIAGGNTSYSGYTLYQLDKSFRILWLVPILALATIERHRNNAVFRKLGAATAVITWIYLGYVLSRAHTLGWDLRWGQSLTKWFAFALFAFSGQLHSTTLVDLVAKKLSSRKAEVYGHSATFPPDFHFSAQDFYAKLENTIRAKEWPGVQLLRIDWSEAGLLSNKRQYLRVIRQRHLFDICAAPFGKDYFFSLREAEVPAVVSVRAFIVLMIALFALFPPCSKHSV